MAYPTLSPSNRLNTKAAAAHLRSIKAAMNAADAPEGIKLLKGTYLTHNEDGAIVLLFQANGNFHLAHTYAMMATKWLHKCGFKRVYPFGAMVHIVPA